MKKLMQTIIAAVLLLGTAALTQAHPITVRSTLPFGNGAWAIVGTPGNAFPPWQGALPAFPGGVAGTILTGSHEFISQISAAGVAAVKFDIDAGGLIQNITPPWSADGEGTSTLTVKPAQIYWSVTPSPGTWGIFGAGLTGTLPGPNNLLPSDLGFYDLVHFTQFAHLSFRIEADGSINIVGTAGGGTLAEQGNQYVYTGSTDGGGGPYTITLDRIVADGALETIADCQTDLAALGSCASDLADCLADLAAANAAAAACAADLAAANAAAAACATDLAACEADLAACVADCSTCAELESDILDAACAIFLIQAPTSTQAFGDAVNALANAVLNNADICDTDAASCLATILSNLP